MEELYGKVNFFVPVLLMAVGVIYAYCVIGVPPEVACVIPSASGCCPESVLSA